MVIPGCNQLISYLRESGWLSTSWARRGRKRFETFRANCVGCTQHLFLLPSHAINFNRRSSLVDSAPSSTSSIPSPNESDQVIEPQYIKFKFPLDNLKSDSQVSEECPLRTGTPTIKILVSSPGSPKPRSNDIGLTLP